MDREISEDKLRKRQLKRTGTIVAVAVAAILLFVLVRNLVAPGLKTGRFRIASVERGPVMVVIQSSGTVVPTFEQVITAPFDTRVQQVLAEAGAELENGSPLLVLDNTEISATAQKLTDQIALKSNQVEQFQISLEKRTNDLKGEIDILALQIEYQEAKRQQQQTLHDKSVATVWDVKQANLTESISRLKLGQLKNNLKQEKSSIEKQIEGLRIEKRLLELELEQVNRKKQRSRVVSETSGSLTWIASEPGATVREGEVVARIAKLTHFRVEASFSQHHSAKIRIGMEAIIKIGDHQLSGTVTALPPAIQNSIQTVIIELQEPNHPALRQNLKADVYLVTQRKPNVLRLKKGPYATSSGTVPVFVIEGNTATRKKVTLGLAGIDYYEVQSGLEEGETVVVSSTDEYKHLKKLTVK